MKILEYEYFENYETGVNFKHNWKLKNGNLNCEDVLRGIIVWCHENWDGIPTPINDWNYNMATEVNHVYDDKREYWFIYPSTPSFNISTNDDDWAIVFKLTWSSLID